jgi:hypothetical protein
MSVAPPAPLTPGQLYVKFPFFLLFLLDLPSSSLTSSFTLGCRDFLLEFQKTKHRLPALCVLEMWDVCVSMAGYSIVILRVVILAKLSL